MHRLFLILSLFFSLGIATNVKAEHHAGEPFAEQSGFVQVAGTSFHIDGKPYRFHGVNMWYAGYLGAEDIGNRERLMRELDFLKSIGVDNIRVLGGSQQSPLRNSLDIAIQDTDGNVDEDLLVGLDFLLVEMAKRDMKAVIYLTNFWEWSGGMATYLYRVNGGQIVDPSFPENKWPAFAVFTKDFYSSEPAKALFSYYVTKIVRRTNTISGIAYSDDPTIMSWQLANEPRPGHATMSDVKGFSHWIEETAGLIKALAPHQLVSTGNEGVTGCIGRADCFVASHASAQVDYLTFHMWPNNWGWIDAADPMTRLPEAIQKADDYIGVHLKIANDLGKPIVLEEFGLPRDNGGSQPGTPTRARDAFLEHVFARVSEDAAAGGPFAGTNLWAWGGFGRAEHADYIWRAGDTNFVGDPPQEAQGLNSVFDVDFRTVAIIREHATKLGAAD